jgi:uncharacterized membrane protein
MKSKIDKISNEGKSKNDLAWEEIEKSFKEHSAKIKREKDSSIWNFITALILLPFAIVVIPLLIFIAIFAILIDGTSSES